MCCIYYHIQGFERKSLLIKIVNITNDHGNSVFLLLSLQKGSRLLKDLCLTVPLQVHRQEHAYDKLCHTLKPPGILEQTFTLCHHVLTRARPETRGLPKDCWRIAE